jgi:hypothetical protein
VTIQFAGVQTTEEIGKRYTGDERRKIGMAIICVGCHADIDVLAKRLTAILQEFLRKFDHFRVRFKWKDWHSEIKLFSLSPATLRIRRG